MVIRELACLSGEAKVSYVWKLRCIDGETVRPRVFSLVLEV